MIRFLTAGESHREGLALILEGVPIGPGLSRSLGPQDRGAHCPGPDVHQPGEGGLSKSSSQFPSGSCKKQPFRARG